MTSSSSSDSSSDLATSGDLDPFPDIEVTLVDLLSDLADGGTTTPPNLQDAMPFIRVVRFGGSDDVITDTAVVSIDAFCAVRADAFSLAEQIRQRLISHPNVVDDVTIDKASTATAPSEVPWGDANVHRFVASYHITARR